MIRVRTEMNGAPGTPYLSTMFFDAPDLTTADDAQSAVHDFWDGLKGLISAGLTMLVLPEVDLVDPATGNVLETSSTPTTLITSTGNATLPAATQGLIRWRTGVFVAGREVRGRTFVPRLANDAQLNGVPSTAFITAGNTEGAQLIAAPGPNFCVWSRSTGTVAVVSSASTWNQFAVLRSRRD